eukprot:scpid3277/ scgid22558/ WD repeat and FYVE domain-containing protein 3; Beach domain, WD repeat and FYVE domain-containing protein 1
MLKISRRKQGISSPLDGNVASTQASELDFALLEQKVMEDDAGGLGIAAALATLHELHEANAGVDACTRVLDILLRCSRSKPHHFRKSIAACEGFFQLLKMFEKVHGCLSREQWSEYVESDMNDLHDFVTSLLLVVVTAGEDIQSKFLFQGLSSGMKQLGCFRRITQFRLPSDLLPDYANPNNDCDESRDDWPFDVRLSNEGNEASAKIDLDSKLVQKIFKHTTLYSASILFSMVSALIRGKADGNLQGSYDGSIPYRAEPRRAVTSEKVMGAIRNPVLVLLLVDLMISLALPCGKQVEDVNKLLLEELHDSEVNCGDRASKVAMLTTEWLFKQWLTNLQLHVANQVLSLVEHDSDKQLLSSHGFLRFILFCCPKFLLRETHCLHGPILEILECMALQSINAHDLWTYLRLGHPLNTGIDILTDLPEDMRGSSLGTLVGYQLAGKAVPLVRVQSLVSMAYASQAPSPPHIQFDMSHDGHGCLLTPPTTLPPVYASTRDPLSLAMSRGVQNSLSTLLCNPLEDYLFRAFPPAHGYSFCSWFMINNFEKEEDPTKRHPVRLLSMIIVRGHQSNKILEILISPQDKSLTINMEDTEWDSSSSDDTTNPSPEGTSNAHSGSNFVVEVHDDMLGHCNMWTHLVVTMEPTSTSSDRANLVVYLNGQSVHSSVISYFSSLGTYMAALMNKTLDRTASGRSSSGRSRSSAMKRTTQASYEEVPVTMNYFVGSLPQQKRVSLLRWRLASMHVIDETLSTSMPAKMYQAGPNYLGSFQGDGKGWNLSEGSLVLSLQAGSSCNVDCNDIQVIAGELVGHAILMETLAYTYGKVPDKKITMFSNTALHLSGQQRPIGAYVMANGTSLTFFRPQPLSASIISLGGVTVFLSLISMSDSIEMLYASLKALVNCTLHQPDMIKQMEEQRQFDLLGFLLHRRMSLVTTRVFQLILTLVGSHTCSGDMDDQFLLPHPQAFGDLLCNLEMWSGSPETFLHWLYQHLVDVVMSSSDANLDRIEDMHLLDRLLVGIVSPHTSAVVACDMGKVVLAILRKSPTSYNLRKVALVLIGSLPENFKDEQIDKSGLLVSQSKSSGDDESEASFSLDMVYSQPTVYDHNAPLVVTKRNLLLDVLENLACAKHRGTTRGSDVLHVFGFDCFYLFIHSFIHGSTVVRVLRFLLTLLDDPHLATLFKEGSACSLPELSTALKQDSFNLYLPETSDKRTTSDTRSVRGITAVSTVASECVRLCQVPIIFLGHFLKRSIASLSAVYLELTTESLREFFNVPSIEPFKFFKEKLDASAQSRKLTFSLQQDSSDSGPAFGGVLPNAHLVNLRYDTLLIIFNLWRSMLNAASSMDVSFIEPSNLSALIKFVTSIYIQSPEMAKKMLEKEFWSALVSCLIPSPVKSSIHTATGHKYNQQCHSHPTVSSNPACDDLLQLLSLIILDSFLIRHDVSLLIDVVDLLTLLCWTEDQAQEAQTMLLRVLMSSLQRLCPLLPGSPFLRQKHRSIFKEKTTLALVQFCGLICDYLTKGLFEGSPTACYRFFVGIVYDCVPTTPHCKAILQILSELILTELKKALGGRQEQAQIANLLYSVRQDQVMVMLSSIIDASHVMAYLYILPRLAYPAFSEPSNSGSPPSSLTYLRARSMSVQEDTISLASMSKSVSSEVTEAAQEVWISFTTWMYEDLSSHFSFTFPHPSKFAASEPTCQDEFQDLIDRTTEKTKKAWNNFCRGPADKKANQKKSLMLSPRSSKQSNVFMNFKAEMTTCDQYVNNKSFDIGISIKKAVEAVCRQNAMSSAQRQITAQTNWLALETELHGDGGLWGPAGESKMKKWQLNTLCEGPCRMRKKLCENTNFYLNYPSHEGEDEEEKQPLSKKQAAMSYDSVALHKSIVSPIGTETNLRNLVMHRTSFHRGSSSTTSPEEVTEEADDTISEHSAESFFQSSPLPSPDSLPAGSQSGVLKMLDAEILGSYPCVLVEGLDVIEGHFAFCGSSFYILRGVGLDVAKDTLPDDLKELAERQKAAHREPITISTMHYYYTEVREVYERRFLLQNCAMEVFLTNGRNHLLAFGKVVRDMVYQRLLSVSHGILSNPDESVSGMKQRSSGLLGSFRMKSVTERWLRDEISNFQYLMHLNTLAGRTYNDLMQYPIFPWVLSDYTSETLDLNNPAVYRDLSQPMGAQSPSRLEQFKKRYVELTDLNHKPYLYGTHYSSAMIVSSFLIRMEPFTQHFLTLQGGQFDLPDRMFHSINEQWLSASSVNMADVKELIPEFFYLPDFLKNSNKFRLGVKQNGSVLNDVILPPWAKGDPNEFIRLHREALESRHVTAHLHEWIDLVFGYKQTGQASQEANNVYHHLFYEGAVNIEEIEDRVERQATVTFINNFGQMPKQLFKKPHPQKKVKSRAPAVPGTVGPSSTASVVLGGAATGGGATAAAAGVNASPASADALSQASTASAVSSGSAPLTMSIAGTSATDRLFYRNLQRLQPSLQPVKELQGPVGCIILNDKDKSIVGIERNRVLVPPAYNRYLAWGFPDFSLRSSSLESDKAVTVYEGLHTGQITCVVCPDPKTVITGGESTVLCVWQLVASSGKEKGRQLALKEVLYGHSAPITCLQASTTYSVIVSAAQDGTCFIWDLQRLAFIRQLQVHRHPVEAICINDLTGDIVTCANTTLAWWSINGDLLGRETMPSADGHAITCCTMSELCVWDSENVIVTGSMDGVVRFWSLGFRDLHYSSSKTANQLADLSRVNSSALSEYSTNTASHTPSPSMPSPAPSLPQQQQQQQ